MLVSSFERARYEFFGMAQSINGGGIYPVNAQIERALDGSNRQLIVLWPPTHRPTIATDSPASIANGSDVYIGLAKLSCFHVYSSSFPKGDNSSLHYIRIIHPSQRPVSQ